MKCYRPFTSVLKSAWGYFTPLFYRITCKQEMRRQAIISFCHIIAHSWHTRIKGLSILKTWCNNFTFLFILCYSKLWYGSVPSVLLSKYGRYIAYLTRSSLSKNESLCTEYGWISLNVYYQIRFLWLSICCLRLPPRTFIRFPTLIPCTTFTTIFERLERTWLGKPCRSIPMYRNISNNC